MSALKAQDPNRGPISLRHDCTPRDLTKFDPAIDGAAEFRLSGDFRFKGWPERAFLHSRNPVRRTKDELNQERHKLAGYPVGQLKELSKRKTVSPSGVERKETIPGKDADIKPPDTHTSLSQPSVAAPPANVQPAGPGKPLTTAAASSSSSVSGHFIRDPYNEKTPSEVAKLQRQMFEADQDILRYKQERIQKLKQETEAKRKDLEMLQKYDPFGRPGAGAPNNGVKKQKFLEEDLTPREQPRYKRPGENEGIPDFFADNFGRPGGGAPLKTDSGNIVTAIKADPAIRFQGKDDLRLSIENHIRYHKPQNETKQYNQELDKQIEQRKMNDQLRKLEDLKKEIDMLKHNPYGKPGAGAPNRTISGNNLVGRRNIPIDGTREVEMSSPVNHQTVDTSGEDYDPWGKGAVQPARLEDGSISRHKNFLSNKYAPRIRDEDAKGTSLEMKSMGGGGGPHVNDNGQIVTRLPVTMNANDFGQNVIKEEVPILSGRQQKQWLDKSQAYFPFGRPGAGAPRRDEEGRILTTLDRKLTRETSSANDIRKVRAAQMYHRDLAKGMEEQKRNKEELENYLKAPMGELASVLREGQVGKPKRDPVTGMLLSQNLHTSDVTQLKINDINYRAAGNSKNYHHDLTKAAEERYRSRELEKLKEKQEAKQHEQVFSHFWGRPGGGAPKTTGDFRKANLDDTLFAKKQNMHNMEYERYMYNRSRGPVGDSEGPQKYVRNTIHSTHANQYDLDANQKREHKVDYKIDAPWAAM